MYLFNAFVLLLNSQIYYKSLEKSKSCNKLFTIIDDIDYGDDIASIPIPIYNNNVSITNIVNSFDEKYYKKLNGYDERYENTIEQFINDKLLLNKIEGFFKNKNLLDRLIKIIKQRNESLNETLNKESNNSSMIYHQYESNIFEQIIQYNNDNRNKSALTYDILAGGLLNDW
jgi:DNA-binding protein Fis